MRKISNRQNRLYSFILMGLIFAGFLAGCATVGKRFTFAGPQSIVIGTTTKTDILKQYGPPFRVGYDSGRVKWTYGYYQYSLFGDSQTKDLSVTFNPNGTVATYDYSSSNPHEVAGAVKQ